MLLSVTEPEFNWLIDFLQEQRGKIREEVDGVFIDSVLTNIRKKEKILEKEKHIPRTTLQVADRFKQVLHDYNVTPVNARVLYWSVLIALYQGMLDANVPTGVVNSDLMDFFSYTLGKLGLAAEKKPEPLASEAIVRLGVVW
jgi:hypothetical protein